MKKTFVRFVAALLVLTLLMCVTGAAVASEGHEDCDHCISGSFEGEDLRAPSCDVCGNGKMFEHVIASGAWQPVYPNTTRICSYNPNAADVLSTRFVTYQSICSNCGFSNPPYTVYEYAWYCPITNSYGS